MLASIRGVSKAGTAEARAGCVAVGTGAGTVAGIAGGALEGIAAEAAALDATPPLLAILPAKSQ